MNSAQLLRTLVLASLVLASLVFCMPAWAALKAGDQAPAFQADAYLAGQPLSLSLASALKQGPLVLYFFPAAHTPGCNIEAHLFSEAIDDFKAAGATVIGITAGNTEQLAAFSKETEHCAGKFAVAADPGAAIAKQYDALLGIKPDWSSRTSYLIATDGKIAHVFSEMSPKQHVREMLDALSAMQTTKPADRVQRPAAAQ